MDHYPFDQNEIEKILDKKEFRIFRDVKTSDIRTHGFVLQGNQMFERNFMNPNTPFTRLLIKDEPGTGKTISSLVIAKNFIDVYHRLYQAVGNTKLVPNVVRIGFTRKIFQNELLRRPELGMVSNAEIEYLKSLRIGSEEYIQFRNKLKRRLGKKDSKGFYKFYGYKEFFNQMFVKQTQKEYSTFAEILQAIKDREILINQDLIKSLANNLVICDEIHNLYNQSDMNTWGLAVKCFIDFYDKSDTIWGTIDEYRELKEWTQNREVRLILLSATVATNKVIEDINIMNLILPVSHNKLGRDIEKNDIFDKDGNLSVSGRKYINNVLRGYICYIRDDNPEYFPKKIWMGEPIPIPSELNSQKSKLFRGNTIPYIKSIRVPYSPIHLQTVLDLDDPTKIDIDGMGIYDYALPSYPDGKGIYKNKIIRQNYSNAPKEWLDKMGIVLNENSITGTFLDIENIKTYCRKYWQIYNDIIQIIKNGEGKILLTHDYVVGPGTEFLKNIMLYNGFIDDFTSPTDETICIVCGDKYKNHGKKHDHTKKPAKLVYITGELDKNTMDTMIAKWNNTANLYGEDYILCIGSEVIEESFSFVATPNMLIASPPKDFSSLIQKIKRPYRKNAFNELPKEKRIYRIRLYSYYNPKSKSLGPDEYFLFKMSQEYTKIEEIDKIYNSISMTSDMFYDKIFPSKPDNKKYELGNVVFTPDLVYKKIRKLPTKADMFDFYYREGFITELTKYVRLAFNKYTFLISEDELMEKLKKIVEAYHLNPEEVGEEILLEAINEETSRSGSTIYKFLYPKGSKKINYYIKLENNQSGTPYRFKDSWIIPTNIGKIHATPIDDIMVVHSSYPSQKLKFIAQYKNQSVSNIPLSLDDYSLEFHHNFLRDCITYVSGVLTLENYSLSENHEFYFKMLTFYDRMELVVFADMIADNNNADLDKIYKIYEKFVDFTNKIEDNTINDKELGRFMMTSIAKSQYGSTFNIDNLNNYLANKKIVYSKKGKIIKPGAFMVPIGILVDNNDNIGKNKLYIDFWDPNTETWSKCYNFIPFYIDGEKYVEVENDLIIGYQGRDKGMLNFRFKIRAPSINLTQYTDNRKIPKGNTCNSFTKESLRELAAKLGIKLDTSIKDYCDNIRLELLRREIQEKRKLHHAYKHKQPYKKIRWFYQSFETQIGFDPD